MNVATTEGSGPGNRLDRRKARTRGLNHFASKDELFQTASEEVLERWAQMIDAACAMP